MPWIAFHKKLQLRIGLLLGDMKVTCFAPFVRAESKSHNYLYFECSFSMVGRLEDGMRRQAGL